MENINLPAGNGERKVLIIDDNKDNLTFFSTVLNRQGYNTVPSTGGNEALEIARLILPDLILLDINMPGMDGFELCTSIRSMPRTHDIPVIFITASTDNAHIRNCFECGGNDYIAKPVRTEELIARVKNQIELKLSKEKILEQNQKLKKLNADKAEFMRVAVHDLKNPLYTSLGFLQYYEKKFRELPEDQSAELICYAKSGIEECLLIIHDLLELSAIEDGRMKLQYDMFDMNVIVRNTVRQNAIRAQEKNITVIFDEMQPELLINTDVGRLQQVMDNLLSNALKYSPHDSTVWISTNSKDTIARFEIKDEGPGIREEEKDLLFKKFSKLSARPTGNESSTGLGLSIAKMLIERMDGIIYCESNPGEGAKFVFELPLALEKTF